MPLYIHVGGVAFMMRLLSVSCHSVQGILEERMRSTCLALQFVNVHTVIGKIFFLSMIRVL